MPLATVYRLIVSWLQEHAGEPSPAVLARDGAGHARGWLDTAAVLSLCVEVADNQAALLQTLMETMSEATTVVDLDANVQYWNESAEKIYEINRHHVIGTSLYNHFDSESIRLRDALFNGSRVQRLYHVPRPDRHVLINSAPIVRHQDIIGALSIEQDITELVRLHEELTHRTEDLHNLKQEMNRYQSQDDPFYMIKGYSASIQTAIASAKKVSATDATVLIHGESGVGKELFAQAIHSASRRSDKPFIAINCGAIPAALFESELFGYQGGAFTGAEKKGKPGKMELAHEGTIFLDEIGELPLELQVKLLRALQERQFYRVGGTEPIHVNTRIIAATNRDLEQMVAEGRFREDLYYRLNVFSLDIPSLRERVQDIPELVQLFLQEYSASHEQPVPRLATEVMQALIDYSWPGNIRQLRNVIERLTILQEEDIILPEHLPPAIRAYLPAGGSVPAIAEFSTAYGVTAQPLTTPLTNPLSNPLGRGFVRREPLTHPSLVNAPLDERSQIEAALTRTYGNKKAAAELLGISRGTLYNKMRKYGME